MQGFRIVVGHISPELGASMDKLHAQYAQTGLRWDEILIAHRVSIQGGEDQLRSNPSTGPAGAGRISSAITKWTCRKSPPPTTPSTVTISSSM
jgi:hypothetical protein